MSMSRNFRPVKDNNRFTVPEPSKRSVHNWVKGYTRMAQGFMDGQIGPDGTPQTATGKRIYVDAGDHWVADELFLKVGGRQSYCWNVMDKDSRYILAAHLATHRGENEAIRLMEKVLRNAKNPPEKVTTDGLPSYVDAIRAVFPKGTEHEASEGICKEVNNNLSKRLQGTFRDRTKTQRGLQMQSTGQDYLDGWVLDYNFFKKHHTLKGQTPAEVIGIARDVPWDDSWEGITRTGGGGCRGRGSGPDHRTAQTRAEAQAQDATGDGREGGEGVPGATSDQERQVQDSEGPQEADDRQVQEQAQSKGQERARQEGDERLGRV